MKKILSLLLLFIAITAYSDEFKFYELDADFLKTFQLTDSKYLIETRNQSCLIFDVRNKSSIELYTGVNEINQANEQIRIASTAIFDKYLFISSIKDNRFIDTRNNAILVDSSHINQIIISFINEQNDLIGISNEGEIFKITINTNTNNIEYSLYDNIKSPAINFIMDSENYVITVNGGVYNSNDWKSEILKLEKYTKPSRINITEDYIIFEYPYYLKKYNKDFKFIDSIFTNQYSFVSKNNGYYVPLNRVDTLVVYEFNDKNIQIDSSFYVLPTKLRIYSINTNLLSGQSLYLFSDRKYICEYDIEGKSFNEISILNLPEAFYIGAADFYNNEIGGICSDKNSLYLTKNGGVTWKRFYEFNKNQSPNNTFTGIKFLGERKFFASGPAYKGTVISDDFGDTYQNSLHPRGMTYETTYFDKLETGNYIQSFSYTSSNEVQIFQKYDKDFNRLKDTYLLDAHIYQATTVKDKIKSISYSPDQNPAKFFVVETDTNLTTIAIDSLGSKNTRPNGIVNYNEKFYMLMRYDGDNAQYLLSSTENSKAWDTVLKSNDIWYYYIYSQNNELYIVDSNYVLNRFNFENNSLEKVVQIPIANDYIKTLTITDDVIYASFGTAFFKGIKIPEFSSQTDVGIEEIPTFSAFPPYPLPTKDFVNIRLEYDQRFDKNKLQLKLYNSNGLLLSENLDYINSSLSSYKLNLNINLSAYHTGVYFIKVIFGNKTEYVPIVKE